MTFKAFKEFMVRFLFENHETSKLYSCNFKSISQLCTILTLNRPGFLQIGMAGGGQILPPV